MVLGQANNMPLKVTECDQNTINSMARYPAFTQSPNPIDESQFFVRQHYLEQFGGDYRAAEMVKAFISSIEYRRRFGTP